MAMFDQGNWWLIKFQTQINQCCQDSSLLSPQPLNHFRKYLNHSPPSIARVPSQLGLVQADRHHEKLVRTWRVEGSWWRLFPVIWEIHMVDKWWRFPCLSWKKLGRPHIWSSGKWWFELFYFVFRITSKVEMDPHFKNWVDEALESQFGRVHCRLEPLRSFSGNRFFASLHM